MTKLKARVVVEAHACDALKGRGYAFHITNWIGPEATAAAVLQRGGARRGGLSATDRERKVATENIIGDFPLIASMAAYLD